ncbi:unnamed protein product [Closterium sp. NIES-65]|nr:unnamed protein product [Closterium sp. NIES-65]
MKQNIDIFALEFDAILAAITGEAAALGARVSATPGAGEAAALGASASAPPGTESTEALHTFTLDSGASCCFFRDRTALEQLARPVAVSLADPSGGPVLATSSTVLLCPAVPSGTLPGLYLPSFSTNLVAGSTLQDRGVHQFTPAYERVTHSTCARTGRHLATFTRQPGSDLYTLTSESPQVAASTSASSQLSAPCSCRSLAHETVLWHHRLGHLSVQRLRAMHSRYLVSGLPSVLPPLPPSPAPPCLPCVEGRQRAAPHSSSFPPTTAPLQTLHMDVWGPARVRGQGQERYFLIVVDDYSRYTTVFPLRTKGEVPDVLIPWIRASHLQLSERFHSDFPVLRLHSDRGGEFSSDLLAAYCAEHGIRQSFTLPASPQQNGVAERRIGLIMEVARTSLIHVVAPHFLWPFAIRYAAHQLNLWPRVSLPETSPTLRWTGEVGDASPFRDVTFDESVPFYRLFPYRTAPLPPPPLFLAPGAAVVDPLPPQGAAPSGVSQVDPVEPVEVAVDSRPARGAERTEPGGAELGRTEPAGAESGGAESGGTEPGSATPGGALSSQQLREWYLQYNSLRRGASGARSAAGDGARASSPRRELPSPQRLREWYARRCSLRSGAPSVADPATGAADPGVRAGAGATDPGVGAAAGAADPGVGVATGGSDPGAGVATGAADPGVGAAAGAVDPGVGAAAGAADPGVGAAGAAGPGGACAGGTGGAGGAAGAAGGLVLSLLLQGAPHGRGRTSFHSFRRFLRVPLPSPPESSLPALADPESDSLRAASPTVTRLLATAVTDPWFEFAAASALVAELVDFAARCRLDYAASLVAESESVCPPSVGGECALSTDVLEDGQEDLECLAAAAPHLVSMLVAPEGDLDAPDIPTPRSYAEAIEGPYSSQWQSAMDAEMASWKSTGTYS